MLEGITEAGRQIRLAAAQHVDATSTRPAEVGGTIRRSAMFSRMVPLDGGPLGPMLNTWWNQATKRGTLTTCGGRFQCRELHGDAGGGWRMTGRVKRLTSLHWVPVVVEIWSPSERFAMLTLTPRTLVLTSERYFRLGHRVLDDLWSELSRGASRTLDGCAQCPSPLWSTW